MKPIRNYFRAGPVAMLLLLAVISFSPFLSAQPHPHPHQGVLTPYRAAPPAVVLSKKDWEILNSGQPVYKKLSVGNAVRGVVIFIVSAKPKTIWQVISNFEAYPNWIEDIVDTQVYRRKGGRIDVKFTAKAAWVGEVTWYATHDFPSNDGRDWASWTLDYQYRSDFDDSVGFWWVQPLPKQKNKNRDKQLNESLVIYSADLKLRGFITQLFQASVNRKNLRKATRWVKLQAESAVSN